MLSVSILLILQSVIRCFRSTHCSFLNQNPFSEIDDIIQIGFFFSTREVCDVIHITLCKITFASKLSSLILLLYIYKRIFFKMHFECFSTQELSSLRVYSRHENYYQHFFLKNVCFFSKETLNCCSEIFISKFFDND